MTVLGIDGGATRSRAALAESGQRLASWEGAPLQLTTNSDAENASNLERLVGHVPQVTAVCLGAAGAGGPATAAARDWLAARFPAAGISVVRDAELILAGAPNPVIALVAGTGVICLGVDRDGRELRADGHGFLLGDHGGAYWVAHEALRRALRTRDRDGKAGALLEELLRGLGGAAELQRLSSNRRVPVSRIAALAPSVCRLAEEGEPVAVGVLEDAVSCLVASVADVRARMAEPARLRVTGGLAWAPPVREALAAQLGEIEWLADGVDGALQLASALRSGLSP